MLLFAATGALLVVAVDGLEVGKGAAPPRRALNLLLQHGRSLDPKPPSFFGSTPAAESNYDPGKETVAVHRPAAEEGRGRARGERRVAMPANASGDSPAAASGVPDGPWQAHFPQLAASFARQEADADSRGDDDRRRTPGSADDVPIDGGGGDAPGARSAGWFEASVRQVNEYGMRPLPPKGSVQRLVEVDGWLERTVSATLSCERPGCSARTVMRAFQGGRESAANCRFTLLVHPTDFDDEYSGERVTHIMVNGHIVNTDCFPRVAGCGAEAQSSMFACVRDLPLERLINESGILEVDASISDVVDECPYQGNMFSAVPLVSCLIAPQLTSFGAGSNGTANGTNRTEGRGNRSGRGGEGWGETSRPPPQPVVPRPPQRPSLELPQFIALGATFRCPERGCTANADLHMNQTALPYRKCLLRVTVNQTDFDGEQGTPEHVEYVRLNGKALLKNVTPGHNPCRELAEGHPLPAAKKEHTLLSDVDVTRKITEGDGHLRIEAKISDFVDECAHEGYLLAGYVTVNCTFGDPARTVQKHEHQQH